MKKLKVDRFDGTMVIFIDDDSKYFAIMRSEIDFELKKGDIVVIDDEGNLSKTEK